MDYEMRNVFQDVYPAELSDSDERFELEDKINSITASQNHHLLSQNVSEDDQHSDQTLQIQAEPAQTELSQNEPEAPEQMKSQASTLTTDSTVPVTAVESTGETPVIKKATRKRRPRSEPDGMLFSPMNPLPRFKRTIEEALKEQELVMNFELRKQEIMLRREELKVKNMEIKKDVMLVMASKGLSLEDMKVYLELIEHA